LAGLKSYTLDNVGCDCLLPVDNVRLRWR